ncbi:MAG: hypothetical protein ACI4PO_09040 [Faecousia sp.]
MKAWTEQRIPTTLNTVSEVTGKRTIPDVTLSRNPHTLLILRNFPSGVCKFNPFHDARGRFASSSGFSTYSANPKSTAGSRAISRSARAGHTSTINVHRESKGENIGQNYAWLHGQYTRPTTAQNTSPTTTKPKTQKPAQKPTQKPTDHQKPSTQVKPGSVADGKAKNAVDGQDLAGKFQFKKNSTDYAIEQVIKAQGFDGKPTITKDTAAFAKACQESNFIAKRGIGASDQQTLNAYDQALKTGDFYVKCSGGSVHGYGMYAASVPANGSKASRGIRHAESTADGYAYGRATKIYTMTLDKSAKIGNENDLYQQMKSDTEFLKVCQNSGMRSSYTQDVGVYAAYKGYDAFIAYGGRNNSSGSVSDYTVILNRSKVIILDT